MYVCIYIYEYIYIYIYIYEYIHLVSKRFSMTLYLARTHFFTKCNELNLTSLSGAEIEIGANAKPNHTFALVQSQHPGPLFSEIDKKPPLFVHLLEKTFHV